MYTYKTLHNLVQQGHPKVTDPSLGTVTATRQQDAEGGGTPESDT